MSHAWRIRFEHQKDRDTVTVTMKQGRANLDRIELTADELRALAASAIEMADKVSK